jgi:hypothetical protein
MRDITIQVDEEEYADVVMIANLKGVKIEAYALDGLRCFIDADKKSKVDKILGVGTEYDR